MSLISFLILLAIAVVVAVVFHFVLRYPDHCMLR
jgi:hypothetical protein